jgi:hypothetical protein
VAVPQFIAILEADDRFHSERLALYRARRYGSRPTNEARFRQLERTARLAAERLRAARAAARSGAEAVTAAGRAPADAELVALARTKLATGLLRVAELDRLRGLLHRGERVVTLCDALFTSGREARRGLIVLTEARLLCLDTGSRHVPPAEVRLPAITAVAAGVPRGSGDAKRGELTMLSGSVETQLARVRPWERAEEIAGHIRAAISARDAVTAEREGPS